MKAYLTPLLFFQRFFLPCVIGVLCWAIWRTFAKKDLPIGLALYLGVVVFVDSFMNTGLYLPGVDKGSIRFSEIIAVFLLWHRPPAGKGSFPQTLTLTLVVCYFLLLLGSVLRSDSLLASVMEFRVIIIPQIVALLLTVRGFKKPEDYRRLVPMIAVVVLIIAVFDFWDIFFDYWLLHSDTLFSAKYYMNRKIGRFGSVFLNPNMLGAFMVLVFPLLFIWAMNEPIRWRKALAWVSLMGLSFCVVETQSRGPLLALGVSVPMLAVGPCGGISRSRRIGTMGVLLMLFTMAMPGFYEHAIERFDQLDKEMSSEEGRTRETVWIYAKQMIAAHPITGIGFGEQQFLKEMDALGFRDKYAVESLDNPHNSYLQMTVYAGLPALFMFVAANLLLLASAALVSLRNVDMRTTPQAFGLAVGVLGYLAVIYPDMHMFTQNVAPVYWAFFGLIVSLTNAKPATAAAKLYEDSSGHVGNAREHLARQLPPSPTRDRWDRDRAPAARVDRPREDGASASVVPAVRRAPNDQQAAVQPRARLLPLGYRGPDTRRELLSKPRADDVRARAADARRRKRE